MVIDLNEITTNEDFVGFNKDELLSYIDPNKETIVYIGTRNIEMHKYSHVYGYMEALFSILKKKYNVIFIAFCSLTDKTPANVIPLYQTKSKKFVAKFCKRKKEYGCNDREYVYSNFQKVYDYINSKLNCITNIKYVILHSGQEWRLQLQQFTIANQYKGMFNEFHDYVGDEPKVISDLEEITTKVANTWPEYCNLLAFSQHTNGILYAVLKCIVTNNKESLVSIDTSVIDPVIFCQLFESFGIKSRNFYFANDIRGTRKYQYFPIAELQHIIYDTEYYKNKKLDTINDLFNDAPDITVENHSKNFFYMGSILNVKGSRTELWNRYLRNFNYADSDFYIPPVKQGIISKNISDVALKKKQEAFPEFLTKLLNEIESHPLYNNYILPEDVNKTIDQYKYSLILRCVSCCDSLNYRPVLYTYHRVLFFLDPMYDPCYLQIPKEIQDKLRVNNAREIMDKIDYFEQHPEEREEILDYLWNYYSIDKWLEPGYAEKEIWKYYP